ncbi:MAG TPA: efflux RND transporter periplasmic adaptor subunit [Methylomirabilota bacterium]|nr:efflux RND transporter periplasmic adaptor subunit [Methylomirabilota bacterium]
MSSETTPTKPSAPIGKRGLFLGLAALALGLFIWAIVPRTKALANEAFYNIRRGDFLISIVEGGTIEAVSEVVVRSELEGTARIIQIVPEGTYVKKGDLLVEMDSSAAQDQLNQQLINYEKARYTLIQAQEQLEIQKSIVESDVRAAELKLEFAKKDLQKYVEGESLQLRRNLEIELTNIRENLALAEERFEWSEKLAQKGFETKSNLDKDRLAVSQYKLRHEQAQKALELFEKFDYPKQKRQLESNVDEAGNELARVKLQGERRLAQYKADVSTQESTLELSKKKLERDEANVKACKIFAPQDGLVVYAISQNRFSNESLIEAGATVRNRQELIKLPDVSEMKLLVKIHESHVTMVQPGQTAYIVLDSMPDQKFRGVVKKVALLPDASSRWGNPNLKVYPTEILLTETLPNVKPGVSAKAEIVVTNLTDVITVPLQAVTTAQGRQVAYVQSGDQQKAVPVEVGMYNTKMIQIVSGLNPGDRVLLSPPLDTEQRDLGGAILTHADAEAMTNVPAVIPAEARPVEPRVAPEQAAAPADGPGRASRAGAPGAEQPAADGAVPARPRFNREEMMKQMDTNGDGEVDEAERTAARERFRQAGGGFGRGGTNSPGNRPRFNQAGGENNAGGGEGGFRRGGGGSGGEGGASREGGRRNRGGEGQTSNAAQE